MAALKISPARKKKIRTLLAMMNKQNKRLIPIAPPLIEMMDLTVTEKELDYLLMMGIKSYDYEVGLNSGNLPDNQFRAFFEEMQKKGLVHVDFDENGKEKYRLNAIAVGWYETMVHYLSGKPQETAFSEKWNEFFKYFRKFNFFPFRELQNMFLSSFLKPAQDTAILKLEKTEMVDKNTIPINTAVSVPDSTVYPTYLVNELIEKYGNQNEIYVFPCVCRYGNDLLNDPCDFDFPKESCISFGKYARAWANWGYGRHVSKEEAIDILKMVQDKGAIHSVIHERDDFSLPVAAICNCCWDCCGILKPYNMGAVALKYRASFVAKIRTEAECIACGNCAKHCPTTAIKLIDETVTLNEEKCIGCGQCSYQCKHNSFELIPKERIVFLPILKKNEVRVAA